ncbi:secreted glycosyltransferase, possible transmembrane domain near C-terminus [Cryptosporidium parvum Iowa II]|uniref:UDP-N-acetylglucosamine transferase subunit ALG14 n=1 Tax=Cryptosporidium parvum (strain Iowa II) TaxID=353152 RepID=Q5CXU3_CRYPI|nr:secreted glycosyltransferase, possible transmembrane domain near C-terminus [Cryptosporidium parvum Iowa II]EAK90456.1 secreted glycosyltransferase, possible transmembrane domain near C-terminus [Cryptosporidium parvum Iowa II]
MYGSIGISIFLFLFALRFYFWVRGRFSFNVGSNEKLERKSNCGEKVKILVVLGSGGHTAELLMLLKDMDLRNKVSLSCVVANTDKFSLEKAINEFSENLKVDKDNVRNYVEFYSIKRSREVGQSYFSSVFTTLASFMDSMRILFQDKYDLIMVNGPGTCIPICFGSLILEVSNSIKRG